MSAHPWKVEYHCIGSDEQAFAWHETLDEAKAEAAANADTIRIEQVTYYLDDRETVWEKAA